MRRMEFSIEDNGPMLEIGQTIGIKEYQSGNYYYMLDHSLGMSAPCGLRDRLKSTEGRVVEKKKTARLNIAVLEFDE